MKTPQESAPSFHPGRHLEIFDGAVIDPYQQRGKYAEPTVCSDCGAVYQKGRWQWSSAPVQAQAHNERCPACARIREDMPAGYLTIKGIFVDDVVGVVVKKTNWQIWRRRVTKQCVYNLNATFASTVNQYFGCS